MFIPIATDRPRKRPTRITYALMAINAVIFIIQSAVIASSSESLFLNPSSLPSSPSIAEKILDSLVLASNTDYSTFHPWALISYQFLHGGMMHLIGNMLFLFVFGPPVEDRLTRTGFAFFYLLGGIIAGAAHITFDIHPVIGASGSVAAVTGAFLVLFPRTHIKILLFFFFIGVYSIPAWWFIAFAITKDFVLQGMGNSGVAHLAHIAGYLFGAAIPLILLWQRIIPREPYDLLTIGRQAKRRRDFKELASSKNSPWRADAAAPTTNKKTTHSSAIEEQCAELRTQIATDLADSKLPAAAIAYTKLLSLNPTASLPRDDQIRLANHLFQSKDHENAAAAYAVFLEKYKADREAPHITLMLALISARYLNDPIKARNLIDSLDAVSLPDDHARLRDTLRAETA